MSSIQKLRFAGVILAAGLVYGALSELSLGIDPSTSSGPRGGQCVPTPGSLVPDRASPCLEAYAPQRTVTSRFFSSPDRRKVSVNVSPGAFLRNT